MPTPVSLHIATMSGTRVKSSMSLNSVAMSGSRVTASVNFNLGTMSGTESDFLSVLEYYYHVSPWKYWSYPT